MSTFELGRERLLIKKKLDKKNLTFKLFKQLILKIKM